MTTQEEYPTEGRQRGNDVDDAEQPHEDINSGDDKGAPKKTWMSSYVDDLANDERHTDHAPVVLPWRIGLFLLTSTITQNLCYAYGYWLTTNLYSNFTADQQARYSSLVYYVLYLGPLFGLVCDFVRIRRERYRPVIIIATIINAVIGFVCFATKDITLKYGAVLMVSWLMQVVTMFVYIPMNAVVINYGNSVVESPDETSARIGGMMAQAMVWRTSGSFLYTVFSTFAYNQYPRIYVNYRWFCLIGAIFSLLLVFQVIFLMKRHYFTDYIKVSVKNAQRLNFYREALHLRHNKKQKQARMESPLCKVMFILCFTFIYFMLPDPLYNTKYFSEAPYTSNFSSGLNHAISVISALAAVMGALAYALWMYMAQRSEAKRGRMWQISPFLIVLAGCLVWDFGIFFHFFGEMGSSHPGFKWKVYIPFETFVVGFALRFAFMPSLSLAAMHCPRFFEATVFEIYSVATSGGSLVSSAVTSNFMSSLNVTVSKGYWKALLLFLFFRLLPILIGGTLPRYRDDSTIPAIHGDSDDVGKEHEPLHEMSTEAGADDMQPIDVNEPRTDGEINKRES